MRRSWHRSGDGSRRSRRQREGGEGAHPDAGTKAPDNGAKRASAAIWAICSRAARGEVPPRGRRRSSHRRPPGCPGAPVLAPQPGSCAPVQARPDSLTRPWRGRTWRAGAGPASDRRGRPRGRAPGRGRPRRPIGTLTGVELSSAQEPRQPLGIRGIVLSAAPCGRARDEAGSGHQACDAGHPARARQPEAGSAQPLVRRPARNRKRCRPPPGLGMRAPPGAPSPRPCPHRSGRRAAPRLHVQANESSLTHTGAPHDCGSTAGARSSGNPRSRISGAPARAHTAYRSSPPSRASSAPGRGRRSRGGPGR